ncbi:MAG: spore coat associated protein CotJA [Clostridia bacterium]|nr:spore coat associated protein CotJA [Clostridia bacterium]
MIPYELDAAEGAADGAAGESTFPAKVSLAMAYVPFQRFENLYDPEKALARGTLFACLDLPFTGGKKGVR